MFIAGMSNITEPPLNDYWTVPGEAEKLKSWQKADADFFNSINPVEYYHQLQIEDFIEAITQDREPLVTGQDGRATVELFEAIYRSQKLNKPVKFPLCNKSQSSEICN